MMLDKYTEKKRISTSAQDALLCTKSENSYEGLVTVLVNITAYTYVPWFVRV